MKRRATGRLLASGAAGLGLLAGATAGVGASETVHPTVVSRTAAPWTPNLVAVSGERTPVAFSITEAGTQMVVGGRFSVVENSARTQQWQRKNVVAFSATTGAIDETFAPQVDGDVWSLLTDGTSVYLGGSFKHVNGVRRPAVAKLDLATGQLDPTFAPPLTTGRVTDMELHRGRLVIAGTFGRRLLALKADTGKSTPYIPQRVTGKLPNSDAAQVFKFDISPDGSRLVAVGNFTTVDDQARPRAFMLNLGEKSSALSDWRYQPLSQSCTSTRRNAIAYVQDVDFSPDSSYFALASFGYVPQSGGLGTQLCDSVARFETDELAPTVPTWINYTGGDSLKSVAVTGAAVYVQGHNRWLDNPYGKDYAGPGAVDRRGGGAVDPTTGMALPWNPAMPAASGGYQILPTAQGVWFVTDGTRFGGKYRRGIRFAPLP